MKEDVLGRHRYRTHLLVIVGTLILVPAALAQEPMDIVAAAKTVAAKPVDIDAAKETGSTSSALPAKMHTSEPSLTETTEPEEGEKGAAKSGIQIHGHWVIEVKHRDGSTKERREFENSYNGGSVMGLILGGLVLPTDPAIILQSSVNDASSFCNVASSSHTCIIFASAGTGQGSLDTSRGLCASAGACYTGLTATVVSTQWVLSATIRAVTSGTFDTVSTSLTGCHGVASDPLKSSETSYDCWIQAASIDQPNLHLGYIDNFPFTSTVLAPVAVAAGEAIVITVRISFS